MALCSVFRTHDEMHACSACTAQITPRTCILADMAYIHMHMYHAVLYCTSAQLLTSQCICVASLHFPYMQMDIEWDKIQAKIALEVEKEERRRQ